MSTVHAPAPHTQPLRVILWLNKWLGWQALTYLRQLMEKKTSQFMIAAIVVSGSNHFISKIEKLAAQHKISVYQDQPPPQVQADLGFCIAFPKKIASSTIAQCARGIINLHFAPLPMYRGSGTLTWAMLHHEKEYGVTLHLIDHDLDTGPIITQQKWPLIPDTPVAALEKVFERHALAFFKEHVERCLAGDVTFTPQPKLLGADSQPTLYTKQRLLKLYHLPGNSQVEDIYQHLLALPHKKNQKVWIVYQGYPIYFSLGKKLLNNSDTA